MHVKLSYITACINSNSTISYIPEDVFCTSHVKSSL